MRKQYLFSLIGLLLFTGGFTQKPIGQWTDYLSYNNGIDVAELNGIIYCATPNAIFSYNTADNSLSRLTRINSISDIGITKLGAISDKNALLIGYENGNIDMLQNGKVYNIPDLKNSTITGTKKINSLFIYEEFAFLSTGLGILVFDIERREIKDTYSINSEDRPDVFDTTVLNDTLYAATSAGVFKGSLSDDLTIFNNWYLDLSAPDPFSAKEYITTFKNKVYLAYNEGDAPGLYVRGSDNTWTILDASSTINSLKTNTDYLSYTMNNRVKALNENNQTAVSYGSYNDVSMRSTAALISADRIYISDGRQGLVKSDFNATFEIIHPDGPGTNASFTVEISENNLWLAAGSPIKDLNPWANNYSGDGFSGLVNNAWTAFSFWNAPELEQNQFMDVNTIAIDPEDPAHVFLGSWFGGVVELRNNEIVNFYDETNSTLEYNIVWDESMAVGGMDYDENGVLWITNAHTINPLSALLPTGEWISFNLNSVVSDNRSIVNLIVSQNGDKWIIKNRGGLVVFSENGNIGDPSGYKMFNFRSGDGNGGLSSDHVYSIAEDLDGEIWVGTDDGISVFYSPQDALSDNPSDARQIMIEQDGNYQLLLESQRVTAIAVDGANRKWIGTNGSGVFLLSSDGTEQILRFTSESSPLFSDIINDIEINQETGEVFFATANGLISYKGDAIIGDIENNCRKVYPNPVREDYNGPIAITGLLRDAAVKITDVRGNLIYETISNGSQAIWNAQNLNGERVQTGVYFALSTNADGSSTCVSKILVIK